MFIGYRNATQETLQLPSGDEENNKALL